MGRATLEAQGWSVPPISDPIVRRDDQRYRKPESRAQAAIELAITLANADWLSSGEQQEVYAGNGSFSLLNLAMKSGVRLIFGDKAVITKTAGGGAGSQVIRMHGALGVTSALQSNVAAGSVDIPVANGALFPVGSIVMVREQTFVITTVGQALDIAKVKAVNSNTVTLDRPVSESYTTAASAELVLVSDIQKASIEGGTYVNLIGAASTTGGLLSTKYAIECGVSGVELLYPNDDPGMKIETSRDCEFADLVIRDGQNNSAGGGGHGYAVCVMGSSQDIKIRDVSQYGVRESNATERARGIEWHGHWSRQAYASGLNTHACGVRDFNASRIRSYKDAQAFSIAGAGRVDGRVFVEDIICYDSTAGSSVSAAGSTTYTHSTFELRKVRIFRAQGTSPQISLGYVNDATVDDVLVDGAGAALSTAVQLTNCVNGIVRNNKVKDSSGGIRIDSCTSSRITGCHLMNITGTPYRETTAGTANMIDNNYTDKGSGQIASVGTPKVVGNSWQ